MKLRDKQIHDEALEFDEVDPDVVELASTLVQEKRRRIQPPDVKDLRLKDTAGGGMLYSSSSSFNEVTNMNYDKYPS